MAGSGGRIRLAVGVDFDPAEGWDAQDPHVVVLDLLPVRDQVLTAVHVHVVRTAVRGGDDDGAGVHPRLGRLAARGLLEPARGGDVVHIDDVHLRLRAMSAGLAHHGYRTSASERLRSQKRGGGVQKIGWCPRPSQQ